MTPSSKQNPGCLASVLRTFGIKQGLPPVDPLPGELPYRLRDDFLSPAEGSFYLVLKNMMGERFTICPKVSLADVFFVVRPNENMSAYNRINRKHVDFLICEPKTMKPVFAIELDDSSHRRAGRVERDAFVEWVFKAAALPLVRVPVRPAYSTAELGALFRGALQPRQGNDDPSQKTQDAEPPGAYPDGAPYCLQCGVQMVLRTARKGARTGRQFYGCVHYPKCRVVIPI